MSDNNSPLISVIIPVYNGTNYLHEAIESVLGQTYTNYELLVVDDGSIDETWWIIESYGTKIRGIHKENGGVASALNRGIRQAKGKYIAWLSHDDLFLPDKLERQVGFLQENKEFKACYTDSIIINAQGKIISEIATPWYPREKALQVLFGDIYINGSSMLIDRFCFDQVGLFSEELKYTQDAEMWMRLMRQFDIGHLPEKLVKQRSHPGQGSASKRENHRNEVMRLYQRIFDEWGFSVIFPEFAKCKDDPMLIACAHNWFGDTMAFHRGFYDFADDQYRKSRNLWHSWRNPAYWRLFFGSKILFFPKRLYHYFLWRLFAFRFPVIQFNR